MTSNDDNLEKYEKMVRWESRVMRHADDSGHESFAIHEVYFNEQDEAVGVTKEALSMHEPDIPTLEKSILLLLEDAKPTVRTGDLNYEYEREDLADWMVSFDLPILDYFWDQTT